ncbi:phage tail tape measure protein [Arsenophonus endosymbiont of Aphis craccivora]|uniref:phage tail tape measure protein n=1 Tax=Arsenophonus endosymbiont of Aphis craccivora TaxID=1231049 RepID=UPI0015DC93A9|nr:phage tail tape measure protein [Arsenophonus endosymbiont of Aphis craccivora]QLK87336.1 phage tail tape measure protein [Arsenophonus endosymbiont of Aphis craccivora]
MANSIELKAIITAVDKLSAPLKGMRREMKTFKKEFSAGMAGAAALGAGIVTAMAGPIKQAIDFESTMADVRKVVDFDTPAQFKQMSEDILKLSTELPMAEDGIWQIVAAGGQEGIAKEELMSFAQSDIKMGIAFDQTAEQSGQMMAQWRTAFRLTQNDVVSLADKINTLGNNGPANAAKISEIVTRIGPLGEVAGLASVEIAALGATIAGMGVESDVAATGIKNFMLALTKGKSATKSQKIALHTLKISPQKLAAQMQKDAKGAMLMVLKAIEKVPKKDQAALLNDLFGSESLGAIAPLLTNLKLLEVNLDRVADKQKYGGSMQKEYASRAATTANAIQLFKNQMHVASVSIGSIFLPSIVEATKKIQPLIEQFRTWSKAHPELIKSFAKWGLYLLGTATAVGVVTRAFRIFNSVMKMSTLGKLVTLMVIGGGLIVENWETIGPMIKSVWKNIDGVIQAIGGWETVLAGILVFVTTKWAVDMVKSIRNVTREMKTLAKNSPSGIKGVLGKAGLIGGISMGVEPLVDKGLNAVFGGNEWFQNLRTARDWSEFGRSMIGNSHLLKYDKGNWQFNEVPPNTLDSFGKNETRDGEVRLIFENTPPGMRVAPVGNALPWLSYDVGYNRFSKQ